MSCRRLLKCLLAAVAVVAVIAGCSDTQAGTPTAASPDTPMTGPPSESATTATTDPHYPPPPREIPLDGVNPCELWTPDQLRDFGVDLEPWRDGPVPNPFGGQECAYSNDYHDDPALDYSINTYPKTGVAEAARSVGAHRIAIPVTIAGFPAAQVQMSNVAIQCDIIIGTATGQYLGVSVGIVSDEVPSMTEHCAVSMAAAELAMEKLLELK